MRGAHAPVATNLAEVDQADYCVGHDRAECGRQQILEERGEEEHGEEHEAGMEDGGHLRALPGGVGDRCLREAAVCRVSTDEPRRRAGRAFGDEFLVPIDGVAVLGRHRPRRSERL